jgi:hypothetical protein
MAETKRKRDNDDDLGRAEVEEKLDTEQEQGFKGSVPDPTPNENYSVAGVTKGKPTPETDARQFEKARAELREVSGPERGEGEK